MLNFSRLFLISRQCLLLAVFASLTMQAQAELQFADGFVRAMPPGQPNSAAFMRVTNTSDKAVYLVAASTPQAEKAEFHNHTVDDKGIMRMRAVDRVEIPAGGQFEFKPGSYHVMIMGLKVSLRPMQIVDVQLQDADGKQYELRLPVKSLVPQKDHGHHHSHHQHH